MIDVWTVWNLTPITKQQCEAINAYEFSDTGWDWLLYTDHME